MPLVLIAGYPWWAVILGGLMAATAYVLLRRSGPAGQLDICVLGHAWPPGARRTSWMSVLDEVAAIETEVRRDEGIDAGSMVVLHGIAPPIVGLPFHYTGAPASRGTMIRRNEFIRIARPGGVRP